MHLKLAVIPATSIVFIPVGAMIISFSVYNANFNLYAARNFIFTFDHTKTVHVTITSPENDNANLFVNLVRRVHLLLFEPPCATPGIFGGLNSEGTERTFHEDAGSFRIQGNWT